ncbi:hypothetical protein [Mucilaginibacter sp.]
MLSVKYDDNLSLEMLIRQIAGQHNEVIDICNAFFRQALSTAHDKAVLSAL